MFMVRITAALLLAIVIMLGPRSVGAATTLSVRDTGATGDGVTDDTAAIQRAIDAVGDAGIVLFPPGIYRLTQVRIGSGIALVGAAAGAVTLRNTESTGRNFSAMVTSIPSADGVTDVEIRNLTFERTVETDAFDEHVYLENCRRVVIERSRFVGRITSARHAQKAVHLRGCRYARILANIFEDIADNALALNWLDAATVSGHHVVSGNVFVRTSTDPGSQIVVTQSDVTIVGNAFHGGATDGSAGNWIETGTANGTVISALTLTGNTVRGFGSLVHDMNGLAAVGNVLHNATLNVDAVDGRSADVAFVGNVATGGGFLRAKRADHVLIEGNVVSESTREGIAVQEASNVSVLGNRVRRAQRSGVLLDTTTGAVLVAGNACNDNGQAGLADAAFGVLIQGVPDLILAGNLCPNTQVRAETPRYGLGVDATRRVALRDNAFDSTHDGVPSPQRLVAAWSPPTLAAGTQTVITLALAGAELGDLVLASFSRDLHGLQLSAYVAARNTVAIVLRNGTADTADLGPGRVKVQLLKADGWMARSMRRGVRVAAPVPPGPHTSLDDPTPLTHDQRGVTADDGSSTLPRAAGAHRPGATARARALRPPGGRARSRRLVPVRRLRRSARGGVPRPLHPGAVRRPGSELRDLLSRRRAAGAGQRLHLADFQHALSHHDDDG